MGVFPRGRGEERAEVDGGVRRLYPIPLAALGYFPCQGKEEVRKRGT